MSDIELSCREFTKKLSSKSPTPGGGGASALIGAIGASLCSMVGNLTIGKKKYASVESEISDLTIQVNKYRDELLELVECDAVAFEPLSKAYSLPAQNAEECSKKEAVLEVCLNDASSVPIKIMETCCKIIDLIEIFAEKGSVLAVSDAACAAAIMKCALQCAALNVSINTKSMKNRSNADKINKQAIDMLDFYIPLSEKTYNNVSEKLWNK